MHRARGMCLGRKEPRHGVKTERQVKGRYRNSIYAREYGDGADGEMTGAEWWKFAIKDSG
jgi:hypothetical protein